MEMTYMNYKIDNEHHEIYFLRKMHTMTIRKPETSFHADGNSDIAKIRRELKLGCGYAYVMVFDGGFKVGLT